VILSSLFPVFALILLGAALKRRGLTNDAFLATSDRLVYFIFFPAMLFWKIGGADPGAGIPWRLCLAVAAAVVIVYVISTAAMRPAGIPAFQAGSFSQSCYRFNTYIGVAIAINAMDETGVRLFGILIGFLIPLINVLAVSTLTWFSGRPISGRRRFIVTLKALVSNPLIVACLTGLLYSQTVNRFPPFIDNTLQLMSLVTLPLALMSIGGALNFANLRGYLKPSLLGALIKLAILPLVGYGMLVWLQVTGSALQTAMIFFALPTSPSIYVLSSQLGSDTALASATIVVSTVLSFFSLSAVMILFF
jgi:predicted permease